jgi:signal transduction histidine kinase
VAAYRIAQEALTNVVRHAHAHTCTIQLALDVGRGVLDLAIEDNGRGVAVGQRGGVGLRSMRERAEELGGTCTLEALPQGGTRVRARLPCRLAEAAAREAEPAAVADWEE